MHEPAQKQRRKVKVDICDISVGAIENQLKTLAKDGTVSHVSLQPSSMELEKSCESDPESPSDSDSDSSSGSSDSSGSDSAVEEPLLTADSATEEKEIQSIVASAQRLKELQGSMSDTEVPPKEVHEMAADEAPSPINVISQAEKASSSSSKIADQPLPATKLSSFCNKNIGLAEVGLQLAAKLATCRHCNVKIPRWTARYSYAYSRSKFAGWIHAGCLTDYLKKSKADLSQARTFFNQELGKPHSPEVLDSLRKLEKELAELW